MDKLFFLKYGARQLRAALSEAVKLNGGPDHTRPMHVRAMVNDLCNYRCGYCNFWRLPADIRKTEMSIEEWKTALRSVRKLTGWTVVQFSGGEPFIKKGFVDLLEWCHQEEIPWGVITNGSALNEVVCRRVVEAHPTNLDISVDAPVAQVNDALRGREGGLHRVVRGVGHLNRFRAATGHRFPIRLKPVVTRPTIPHLVDMVRWAQEIGADTIDFNALREWDNPGPTHLHITSKADSLLLERQVERLLELKRSGAPIETTEDRLKALVPHSRGEQTFSGVSPCRVGMRELHIRPNGDLEVCWFFDPIGNLRGAQAKDLWHSERARRIREETIHCTKFGTVACANSCLTHRKLGDQLRRGVDLMKRTGLLPILNDRGGSSAWRTTT